MKLFVSCRVPAQMKVACPLVSPYKSRSIFSSRRFKLSFLKNILIFVVVVVVSSGERLRTQLWFKVDVTQSRPPQIFWIISNQRLWRRGKERTSGPKSNQFFELELLVSKFWKVPLRRCCCCPADVIAGCADVAMDSMTFRTTTLALAPCHHPTAGAASCIQPVVLRPLRTLNNIHQTLTPHVIQLRPESSPNLSGNWPILKQ